MTLLISSTVLPFSEKKSIGATRGKTKKKEIGEEEERRRKTCYIKLYYSLILHWDRFFLVYTMY
jgi:hypothetical protein